MEQGSDYNIDLDVKFGFLELIDMPNLAGSRGVFCRPVLRPGSERKDLNH